jgi:hypothetical protein
MTCCRGCRAWLYTCAESYPRGMLIPSMLPFGIDSKIIRLKSQTFLACWVSTWLKIGVVIFAVRVVIFAVRLHHVDDAIVADVC